MDAKERIKIFDFILDNIDSSVGLFSLDTIKQMRDLKTGKWNEKFTLSDDDKHKLISKFKSGNNTFCSNTPDIFLMDKVCFEVAILNDIKSIDFAKVQVNNLDVIIKRALDENYIITKNTPDFIKKNFDIALNSIKLDVKSANYIQFDSFIKSKRQILINEIIKNGFTIDKTYNSYLLDNTDIIINSIKIDSKTISNIPNYKLKDPKIFQYLYLNQKETFNKLYYNYQNLPITCFKNIEVLKDVMNNKNIFFNNEYINDKKSQDRYISILYGLLEKQVTIKSFYEIFDLVIDNNWNTNKEMNMKYYGNIFTRIISTLKNSSDFQSAMNKMIFIPRMKKALGDKYKKLLSAMKEYFDIYKSNILNKSEMISKYMNIISMYSALYLAISKENYKSETFDLLNDYIKQFYILKKNKKEVKKIVTSSYKKDIFIKLLKENDTCTINFKDEIILKYSKYLNKDIISNMFMGYINGNKKYKDIEQYPNNYLLYIKYLESLKLINRLNRNYITYDSNEFNNYKDCIKYINGKYVYVKGTFTEEEIIKFKEYENRTKIFEIMKKDIYKYISNIEIDYNDIDNDYISRFSNYFPFSDEYFELDNNYIFSKIPFSSFVDLDIHKYDNLKDDKTFSFIYNTLVNKGLMHTLLLQNIDEEWTFKRGKVSYDSVKQILANAKQIINISNLIDYDLESIKNIFSLSSITHNITLKDIMIIGKDNLKNMYDMEDLEDVIKISNDMLCKMRFNLCSTIPRIKGENEFYKYSLYEYLDSSLITTGIKTNSCFSPNNTDNDFLHYCALDKNGFVIKITDKADNFIARAAGVRNGNCIFINQLRTIYDKRNKVYEGPYIGETKEIINIFKQACDDFINKSKNSIDKIDFVFVNKAYILDELESNVDEDMKKYLTDNLIDITSDDFKKFTLDNKNLIENYDEDNYFTTDYGNYPIICIAKNNLKLSKDNLKFKDVDPTYLKDRSKIVVTSEINDIVRDKMNNIKAAYAYINDLEFKTIDFSNIDTVFVGDNWYIVLKDNEIATSLLLNQDPVAHQEYFNVLSTIYENQNSKKLLKTINI